MNHLKTNPNTQNPERSTQDRYAEWAVTGAGAVFGSVARYLQGIVLTVLLGTLQAYKLLISPLLGSRCRFHPSCSVYAQTSLRRFGVWKGGWLAVCRLLRCGPWGGGGIDEVPGFDSPQQSLRAIANTPEHSPDHTPECCSPTSFHAAVNRTRA